MGRGDFRSGGGESPNSTSWKARAEELENQLEVAAAENDELSGRLEEIASIAAPDLNERAERIDQALQELRVDQLAIRQLLGRLVANLPPESITDSPNWNPEG